MHRKHTHGQYYQIFLYAADLGRQPFRYRMTFNSVDALVDSPNLLKELVEGDPVLNLALKECGFACQTAKVVGNSLFAEFLGGRHRQETQY